MQTQHTCILLEDLLDHCNLKCPTCFAESSPARASVAPLAQVLASIDARLSRENQRIDVLMLSGGEPTLYPWLAELLDAVAERPIVRVLVNTNGLRVAQDDELLALLTRHRERVEVYLQYDGESAEASTYHRGADIRRFKERAIERLSANGHLHHAHHDGGPRRERRRDRPGRQARARHAVRRRRDDPARVRQRPVRRDRPARPAHPHRRARAAGRADRRRGDLARPDGAAVLAPALLLGGLPAARRLRHLAVADQPDRPRPAQAVARPRARPARQPDRRRRDPGRHEGGRQGLAPRPAVGAVEPVAPVDGDHLARHLPELRPRHRHPHGARHRGAARVSGSGCGRCWGSGCSA